jgi:hypothetical protein
MNKNYMIVAAVALVLAFAFGRWSAPEKIKIEKEVVTVETKSKETTSDEKKKTDIDTNLEKTVTEITHPDGSKEVVTHYTRNSHASRSSEKEASSTEKETLAKTEKESKEVTKSSSKLIVSGLVGGNGLSGLDALKAPVYGAHVQKTVLGPIMVGAWGLTDRTVGLSLGLIF